MFRAADKFGREAMDIVQKRRAERLPLPVGPPVAVVIDSPDDERPLPLLDKFADAHGSIPRFKCEGNESRSQEMLKLVPVARLTCRRVAVQPGGKIFHPRPKILLRFIRE